MLSSALKQILTFAKQEMAGIGYLPPCDPANRPMGYIHPSVRDKEISKNILDLATKELKNLFDEVSQRVPSAELTPSGYAIIIPSADGSVHLQVEIPIIGVNRLALCLALTGNEVELQMSWTFRTTPRNGLVLCTANPELHPISADKIFEWAQRE